MLLVNRGAEAGFRFGRDRGRIRRNHVTEQWNQGDLHAGWLDADNDGLLDLLIASSDYPDDQILRLYRQREDHTFEDWTERLGFRWQNANQISLADFDGDGATDILVSTSNNRLTAEQRQGRSLSIGLFRNLSAQEPKNRYLSLRLMGQAIGARVIIETGGVRQLREVQGGLGHAGHRDDTECRFGVGQAALLDRLEVRWPDRNRTVQVFTDIGTNQRYRLALGDELEPGSR
jgi:hypothetical protein